MSGEGDPGDRIDRQRRRGSHHGAVVEGDAEQLVVSRPDGELAGAAAEPQCGDRHPPRAIRDAASREFGRPRPERRWHGRPAVHAPD